MTKEVLLTISGLQFNNQYDDGKVEVITTGNYYIKNGKHYILYDEVNEDSEEVTKSIIKVQDHVLDVTKRGYTNVHMIFEENKKNMTYYSTPFGNMLIGITSRGVDIEEKDDNISIKVDYALEINYEFLADCSIKMNVQPKESASFSLSN